MLSTKKVIRDIIAIVLIAVLGVVVYKYFVAPRADQLNQKADPHSGMPTNMTGDGSTFELDNNEDAISIDGKVYSMAELDTKAQHFVRMMGGNTDALTRELLNQARAQAVNTLLSDASMVKGAKELGIEITDEDVKNEIAMMVEEQGGEEKYREFLKSYNFSEEAMERLKRKDILQGSILDALIEKNNLQDETDDVKNETYNQWLGEVSKSIKVEIFAESLKEAFTSPALDTTAAPHGMPPNDETGTEPDQHDH